MLNPLTYRAEVAYRQAAVRRSVAAVRLAKRAMPRRPRRMDSVHND